MPDDRRKRSGLFRILGVVLLLLLAAIVALPFLIDANQFRPTLESEISGALGREVKVGNLELSLISGGVAANEISIADDPAFSRSFFVHAKSLQVGVEMRPLIFNRVVHITRIALEEPEINLIRSSSGNWNFSNIGAKGERRTPEERGSPSSSTVMVGRLQITNARVTVVRSGARTKPSVYDKVNIEARNLAYDSVMPFTMTASLPGGGSAKLEGKAGPVNQGDLSLTALSGNLTVAGFDLLASGFVEPNSGLGGIIDFDGQVTSDGKRVQTAGHAKANKLRVTKNGTQASQPVELQYALTHDIRSRSGTLSDVKAQFGKAVAHLNGSYDSRGESTNVSMKLHGENMPAQDLQALLPAAGITLPRGASLEGGALNIDLTSAGPIDRLATTGTIGISNTRLAGFDLGAKLAPLASMAGIKSGSVTEIEQFVSNLRLDPEGVQARSVLLVVPAIGQLTGEGTVGSNFVLDFKMRARLHAEKGLLGNLSQLAGLKTGSELEIPFFIRGTTSDPKFVPDARGLAGNLIGPRDAEKGGSTPSQNLGNTLRSLFKKNK